MATVVRENIGLLNDKISVKLAKEDYMPAFEQSLKKYAKTANIPGFRKGMVPAGMIKKMHGSSVFTDEVLRTVEKELNNYMSQEQLEIFAQPLPLENNFTQQIDMNNPAEYTFDFEVGLKPVIDINPSTINVTRHKVQVTDEMVDMEVERLMTRHGKMTEPEEVSSDDNVLNVTFTETDAQGNVVEGGISKGNSVLVKYFSESFRPQLIGKKKDDVLQVQLNEAFEEKEREWIVSDLGLKDDATAGDKHFNMTITKVGFVEKPEMNEEFFNAAYPGRNLVSEDDLRAAVKQDIQASFDQQSRNQLHDQIYHALVDHTHIDFPEGFLKRWMEKGGEEPKTAEEAESEYPAFANSLKWTLISTQLGQQHNIQVDPSEIKDFAKQQIMGYMGVQSLEEAPWLDSYADSMLKDKKFIENTYYQLQTTKLFNVLEGMVNVSEDTVTAEQLAGMQHNHAH